MGFDNLFHYVNLTVEVFVVNLLLSGDNAVVIALACRSLPPALTRRAMLIGIDGAIALRVLLTIFASYLLSIPLLKLAGGVALAAIAIKLTVEEAPAAKSGSGPSRIPSGLWSAVGTIIAADLVMSVDNVVALAAVAHGSILILALGLLMSVPFLMFGSVFVAVLLKRYPLLKRGGGAMLGWLAGDIAISDPILVDWVNHQSPALTVVVPFLVAVFVVMESRIIEDARAAAHALRPRHTPRSAAVTAPPAVPAVAKQAPATPAVTLASRSAEGGLPAPGSAAENIAEPRRPESVGRPPSHAAATSQVQASPEKKRIKPLYWIIAVVSLALLWVLFRSLSLDFPTTTPALQWTPPTGHR